MLGYDSTAMKLIEKSWGLVEPTEVTWMLTCELEREACCELKFYMKNLSPILYWLMPKAKVGVAVKVCWKFTGKV